VLQQADYHLSHDTAEQSSSQQNIDSYIYELRPLELNSRKYRDNSDRMWLNSFKFGCCSGVSERASRGAGHYAGHYITPTIDGSLRGISAHICFSRYQSTKESVWTHLGGSDTYKRSKRSYPEDLRVSQPWCGALEVFRMEGFNVSLSLQNGASQYRLA
jgi:hypothetical protein